MGAVQQHPTASAAASGVCFVVIQGGRWHPCRSSSPHPTSSKANCYQTERVRIKKGCRMSSETVTHYGGCHCRHVRWEVIAPASVVAWNCNCSDCSMRGNTHFIVPSSKFKLIGDSEQFITTYSFGTHTAKHTFCKVCGITSFYVPRSNPDGVAVTFRCVDAGTLTHVEIRNFDGKQWESSFDQSSIASFSKTDGKG